jgi:hypothetical protein
MGRPAMGRLLLDARPDTLVISAQNKARAMAGLFRDKLSRLITIPPNVLSQEFVGGEKCRYPVIGSDRDRDMESSLRWSLTGAVLFLTCDG